MKRDRASDAADDGALGTDGFYLHDDDGPVARQDDDDSALASRSGAARSAGASTGARPTPFVEHSSVGVAPLAKLAMSRNRAEDAWQRQQVAAATGDVSALIDDAARRGSASRMDIAVDRLLGPPFLIAAGQPVVLSRQLTIVQPVKDPKSDFVQNAAKGSASMRQFKLKKNEEKNMRDALDVSRSDMTSVTSGGAADQMSAEDADRLRARVALINEQRGEGVRSMTPAAASSAAYGASGQKETAFSALQAMDSASAGAAARSEFAKANSIAAQRRMLPIFAAKDELMRLIRENDVVVVAGETGSGKTTQLAQYLYEDGYCRAGRMIGCTQPRKMAAVSVAHRVSQEVGCALGTTVGYAIRLEDRSSASTKIRFLTDGILLRELVGDAEASKYSAIILDEAHERSINTDVLLGVLKTIVARRSDFKLIVTSATLDVARFSDFFNGAPTFGIPGRTFNITYEWERSPAQDYVELAVFKAIEIHLRRPAGDILIFMTGEEDVLCACDMIRDRLHEQLRDNGTMGPESLLVLPCFSLMPSADQLKIMSPPPAGCRKCVVATNIAETSMTIDGIIYVIDCGYVKTKVFKPNLGINALQVVPVSQAQARQRAGRAGRTAEGVCLRLYSEFQFNHEMLEAPVPEIQRSSVEGVVLLLKGLGVRNLATFDFLDAPPQESLKGALFHLWLLGAIDDRGQISAVGKQLSELPLEPPLARVLVSAATRGCLEECLAIAALLSVDSRSVFASPKGREAQAQAAREKFFSPESDHLTLLNVYQQFLQSGHSRAWAEAHMLNHSALRRAVDVAGQLRDRMNEIAKQGRVERPPLRNRDEDASNRADDVRRCFCDGFFAQAARRRTFTEFTAILTGVPCELHPSSALQCAGSVPDYVIYNDFVLTTKEYMSVVSAVEPEWLVTAGRGLYTPRNATTAELQALLRQEQQRAAIAVVAENTAAPPATAASAALARFIPRRR